MAAEQHNSVPAWVQKAIASQPGVKDIESIQRLWPGRPADIFVVWFGNASSLFSVSPKGDVVGRIDFPQPGGGFGKITACQSDQGPGSPVLIAEGSDGDVTSEMLFKFDPETGQMTKLIMWGGSERQVSCVPPDIIDLSLNAKEEVAWYGVSPFVRVGPSCPENLLKKFDLSAPFTGDPAEVSKGMRIEKIKIRLVVPKQGPPLLEACSK